MIRDSFCMFVCRHARQQVLLLIAILLLCSVLQAAFIYTYPEVLFLMMKSPIHYQLGVSDTITFSKEFPDRDTDSFYYQKLVDGRITVAEYTFDDTTNVLYYNAEDCYIDGNYEAARDYYLAVLDKNPDCSTVMAFVGETYSSLNDYKNEKLWYQKAIQANFHNYMAHWLLAQMYENMGKTSKAVEEVTLAKILNRTALPIDRDFKRMLQKAERDTTDWYFLPQMRIRQVNADTVAVEARLEWMPYAAVEAMWRYEADYHKAERTPPEDFNMSRAGEAYRALNDTYKKLPPELRKNPCLKALYLSNKKKLPRAYILYEYMLPDYPDSVLFLSKEDILNIQKYILKVRHK